MFKKILKPVLLPALFLALISMNGFAAGKMNFAHIADGGGYKTTFLLTNPGSVATTVQVVFYGDSGQPLSLTIGSTTASTFTYNLPARGSLKIQTSGTPSATMQGWAQVSTNPAVNINGNAIFQYFHGGVLQVEASVPACEALTAADIYLDEDGSYTGFAIANPEATAANGTVSLYSTGGVLLGSVPIPAIAPKGHLAKFAFELISNAPSGRLELRLTSGSLAITALRYDRPAMAVFSTLNVSNLRAPAAFGPVLFALNPQTIKAGSAASSFFVSGLRFHAGSKVYWNATELTVTARSLDTIPQVLTVSLPANLVASPATAAVKVENPVGSGNEGTSGAFDFSVTQVAYP